MDHSKIKDTFDTFQCSGQHGAEGKDELRDSKGKGMVWWMVGELLGGIEPNGAAQNGGGKRWLKFHPRQVFRVMSRTEKWDMKIGDIVRLR